MEPDKITNINIYSVIIHGLFAALGGIVRELKDEDDKDRSFLDFIGGAFIGIFSGMVIYFICKEYQVGEYLTIAFVGLAGYLGAPLLDFIAKLMKNRIKSSL